MVQQTSGNDLMFSKGVFKSSALPSEKGFHDFDDVVVNTHSQVSH